jgi:hypothetical protein
MAFNFPVSEYYRDHIKDGETLARGGGWWTAVLVIEDPRTHFPFIAVYRWQSTEAGWKVRKQLTLRSRQQVSQLSDILCRLATQLPATAAGEEA